MLLIKSSGITTQRNSEGNSMHLHRLAAVTYRIVTGGAIPTIPIVICASMVVGCAQNYSQVPLAASYPVTRQEVMQAGHHWDLLAQHEAGKILTELGQGRASFFVEIPGDGSSAFRKAYYDLLTGHLVNNGGMVFTDDELAQRNNAYTLKYGIQVLTHRDRGYLAPPLGTYTALSIGLIALHGKQVLENPLLVVGSAAADFFSGSFSRRSPTEIIVTTIVLDDGKFLFSDSRIYYVNSGDTENYTDTTPTPIISLIPGTTFELVDQLCPSGSKCAKGQGDD